MAYRIGRGVAMAAALVIGLGAGAGLAQEASGPAITVSTAQSGFATLLNAERQAKGRKALALSPALTAVAQAHADDMARKGYFSHRGQDGSTPKRRVKRAGHRACLVAENIAMGQRSEAAVMATWMQSSGHRRNILLPRVREFGLGRAQGDIWVLVLARMGC